MRREACSQMIEEDVELNHVLLEAKILIELETYDGSPKRIMIPVIWLVSRTPLIEAPYSNFTQLAFLKK